MRRYDPAGAGVAAAFGFAADRVVFAVGTTRDNATAGAGFPGKMAVAHATDEVISAVPGGGSRPHRADTGGGIRPARSRRGATAAAAATPRCGGGVIGAARPDQAGPRAGRGEWADAGRRGRHRTPG